MRITGIRAAGLRGGTPEGGWANEIKPEDCIHTLIAVYTDDGITGWGSASTNDALVSGSLGVLEPLVYGREPSRTGAGQRKASREHVLAWTRWVHYPYHQRD